MILLLMCDAQLKITAWLQLIQVRVLLTGLNISNIIILDIENVLVMSWTHKNNVVIFKINDYNPTYVLELAQKMFYATILFNKCTDIYDCRVVRGSNILNAVKIYTLRIGSLFHFPGLSSAWMLQNLQLSKIL